MPEDHHIGYEQVSSEISILVASYPPPFIYINDPTSPRVTTSVITAAISGISEVESYPSRRVHYAHINAIACFTARLFYDSVLNSLMNWTARWDEGCVNWTLEGVSERWNENFDGFIHGLRAVSAHLQERHRKGKAKEKAQIDDQNVRLVILIEQAERLKESLPDLLVPLSRLAELSQLDLTVIFVSEVRWEDIRPPLGASPDPYFIDVPSLTKEVIAQQIVSKFPTSTNTIPGPYHPALQSLYSHFISMLCDVCFPFTHDSQEIEYIAAARWPGFVQPVLDLHQQKIESMADDMNVDYVDISEDTPLDPPPEDVRMRLSRMFSASLSTAMEELYPRLTNAWDWAMKHKPETNLLMEHPGTQAVKESTVNEDRMKTLPRMSKFILVAAFLASTNPAKSDLRMFGRGLDEKKRKRRTRKTTKTKSGPDKIPQRLVGPLAFPLDRLIAILGALLEENDADVRIPVSEYTIPGEYTDMETSRVKIFSAIMELTSMRLLHRTSHVDRLDGPPTFKCGVSYDEALALARQLDLPLNNLMWDPM